MRCIVRTGLMLLMWASLVAVAGLPQCQVTSWDVSPLLTTQWGQREPYNLFAPRVGGTHQRLGCWSTAVAQILYYQRMRPHGSQTYNGSTFTIAEYFSHTFDWNEIEGFVAAQGRCAAPTAGQTLETALFCYHVAVALKKDFNDQKATYVWEAKNLPNTGMAEVATHFSCTVHYVTGNPSDTCITSRKGVEDFIVHELTADRPLMLYVKANVVGKAHAVVIDGCGRSADGKFCVNLNCGWFGQHDGSYSLWDDITLGSLTFGKEIKKGDGRDMRLVVSFEPVHVFVPPIVVDPLTTTVVVGKGLDAAICTIGGLAYPPKPGPEPGPFDYEYDLWPEPEPDPVPAAICPQGAPVLFDFVLVDFRTGQPLRNPTTSISLVQLGEHVPSTILLWDLVSFDPVEGRYRFSVDTRALPPGVYDFYLATSDNANAYRVRIEVVAPH